MFQTVEILFSTKEIPSFNHKYVWLVYPSICTQQIDAGIVHTTSMIQIGQNTLENEEEKTPNFFSCN